MATTLIEAVIQARDVFYKNADVLIAGFLIRHPDVDPADVELVMTPGTGGSLRFSIEPKELHVPGELYRPMVGPEHAQENEWCDTGFNAPGEHAAHRAGSVDGWNACRLAMIAQKATARSPDALVSLLSETIKGDSDG